jgi:hypothetical protein
VDCSHCDDIESALRLLARQCKEIFFAMDFCHPHAGSYDCGFADLQRTGMAAGYIPCFDRSILHRPIHRGQAAQIKWDRLLWLWQSKHMQRSIADTTLAVDYFRHFLPDLNHSSFLAAFLEIIRHCQSDRFKGRNKPFGHIFRAVIPYIFQIPATGSPHMLD